jgi:hypothetical protein
MLMVWECESDEGRAWVERVFSPFGELTTQTAIDATGGMAPCFARDDEAFGRWMQQRGTDETEVERQVALRRAGKDAPDMASAMAAGRAWASGG